MIQIKILKIKWYKIIKFKNICTSENSEKNKKYKPQTEKLFANYTSDKEFLFDYIKNSYNSLIIRQKITKWAKYLNKHFSKKMYKG